MHTGAQDGLIELLSTGAIHMAVTYDLELSHRVSFEAIASAPPAASRCLRTIHSRVRSRFV